MRRVRTDTLTAFIPTTLFCEKGHFFFECSSQRGAGLSRTTNGW